MAKSLLSFQELIQRGWNDYRTHWNRTVQMTLWLLIVPVLQLGIMMVFNPTTLATGQMIANIFSMLQVLMSLWILVRVVRWYLSDFKNDPSYDHDGIQSLKAIPSVLFASIVKSLAVMGGMLLFFFPGLWLAVLLSFTELSVLEDGTRGIEALRRSANLVKGRWWAVFGRFVGGLAIFLILSLITYFILGGIIDAISGLTISTETLNNLANPANLRQLFLVYSTDQILSAIIQALFVPLLFAWQIRLFHSLKETA